MKYFAEVVVHQQDSCVPDYQRLHALLADAGFEQRNLDGTRAVRFSSGLYTREEHVLGPSEVEDDLRFVVEAFAYPCSFHLHLVGDSVNATILASAEQGRIPAARLNLQTTSYIQ